MCVQRVYRSSLQKKRQNSDMNMSCKDYLSRSSIRVRPTVSFHRVGVPIQQLQCVVTQKRGYLYYSAFAVNGSYE